MKRMMAFLTAVFAVLALAGCSGSGSEAAESVQIELGVIMLATPDQPPPLYEAMQLDAANVPAFVFIDMDGEFQHRVFARQEVYAGGESWVEEGYVECGFTFTDEGLDVVAYFSATDTLADIRVDVDAEPFGQATPLEPPSQEVPSSLTKMPEGVGLFQDAGGALLVYAAFDGQDGRFWPAAEDGQMVPGSLWVDVE